jgi:hypothetical protein
MKTGVLVFNLGGPETLDDVKPFLYRLFSDPEIIRIRWAPLRKAIAYSIATLRKNKSQGYYAQIGGGSPLRRLTEDQARALERELRARGRDTRVFVGMCAWRPFLGEAMAEIASSGIERLVILPLFPQYSVTTTGGPPNPPTFRRSRSLLPPSSRDFRNRIVCICFSAPTAFRKVMCGKAIRTSIRPNKRLRPSSTRSGAGTRISCRFRARSVR